LKAFFGILAAIVLVSPLLDHGNPQEPVVRLGDTAPVQYWDCGNGATDESYSHGVGDERKNRACGILARDTDTKRGFAITFRLTDAKDHVSENSDPNCPPELKALTFAVFSYIHIDTDTSYTETVAYDDYSSPPTAQQLTIELDKAVAAFNYTMKSYTYKGKTYPDEVYKAKVVSRRNPATAGFASTEVTTNDGDGNNGYIRIVAAGNRVYRLSVWTDADEDPDEPTYSHVIEKERFFNSFQIARPAKY
jgi:hypothetical protein